MKGFVFGSPPRYNDTIDYNYDFVSEIQLQFRMMNEDDDDYKDDSMMINCIVCIIKLSCKFGDDEH